jgi:hypothetical protein
MIMAVATSLATIVVTSVAAVNAHHRLGLVLWSKVLRLAPGIMLGAAIGAVIADVISAVALRYVFIVFLLTIGVQMAWQIKPDTGALKQSLTLDFSLTTVIGIMSALLGIGGGTLTVPYLTACQYPMRNAVAISSACGLPIAIAGTMSYAVLGWHQSGLPEGSSGYIYLPAFAGIVLCSVLTAPIGARLAHSLPAQQLKRYFSVLATLLARASDSSWLCSKLPVESV